MKENMTVGRKKRYDKNILYENLKKETLNILFKKSAWKVESEYLMGK